MTTLILKDLRAIDFDHVRMVYVGAPSKYSDPRVTAVFDNDHHEMLFNVAGYTEGDVADLVARVAAHCMESSADVVLGDVIIKEWLHVLRNVEGECS